MNERIAHIQRSLHQYGDDRSQLGELFLRMRVAPERCQLASPAARVPLGVRQLLVHGGQDEIVPVAMSRAYATSAAAAGDRSELIIHEGLGHFEHLDLRSEAWKSVRAWLRGCNDLSCAATRKDGDG